MKADPPMLRDPETKGGYLCAVDENPLNDLTVSQQDPFCSTGCANEWHEFVPSSKSITLSGHPADQPPSRPTPQWDVRSRDSRKRQQREA
jgi:hypothetical protein